MKTVIKTFNLLCEDEAVLQLYGREVSIEHNDVFHRLCQLDEKPLGSWRLLGLIILFELFNSKNICRRLSDVALATDFCLKNCGNVILTGFQKSVAKFCTVMLSMYKVLPFFVLFFCFKKFRYFEKATNIWPIFHLFWGALPSSVKL